MMRRVVGSLAVIAVFAPQYAIASCATQIGKNAAERLVRRCFYVSPATHPPCNAVNECDLIRDEIARGCTILAGDAPGWCKEYR